MDIKSKVALILGIIVIGLVFYSASNSIVPSLLVGNAAERGTCFDTDAGVDEFMKGTVSGTFNNGVDYERTDYCIDSWQLKEYRCDATSSTGFEIGSEAIGEGKFILCDNGCQDGACCLNKNCEG
ncbi:hypothetical protein J4404_02400 [Candidatus Woesearchaeota archaeon]|nr:hypothetical protein [Candidatus Woesearchaeota archaeon]